MLNKEQLEDASRCSRTYCVYCNCGKGIGGTSECIEEAAKTALAYREVLEKAKEALCEARGYTKYLADTLCREAIEAIEKLLEG